MADRLLLQDHMARSVTSAELASTNQMSLSLKWCLSIDENNVLVSTIT